MAGGIARAQARCQQASGVALEDEYGMIHVLAVGTVEKAELLLAVGGIVGGVEIEQDLPALTDLVTAKTDELLRQMSLRRTRSRARAEFSQRLSVGCHSSALPSFSSATICNSGS